MPDKNDGSVATRPDPKLEKLVVEMRPEVERYVRYRIRNKEHQEEVVSRVFEALVRSWPNFRGDCPASAFVIRITANAVKNYYDRDLARFSRQISLDVWCERFCLQQIDNEPGPHLEAQMRDEVQGLLREMSKACSDTECSVLELVYQAYTMDEISTLLGLPGPTVRSHVLRGRERLLAHLLVEAPDLLGGTEAIDAAVRRLETGANASLSREEAEAVRQRKGPAPLLRKAMLKLAPYLGVFIGFTLFICTFLRGDR